MEILLGCYTGSSADSTFLGRYTTAESATNYHPFPGASDSSALLDTRSFFPSKNDAMLDNKNQTLMSGFLLSAQCLSRHRNNLLILYVFVLLPAYPVVSDSTNETHEE